MSALPFVDLRSDTVTRPTPAMREAMHRAEVGDDVFGEDPTVKDLELRLARTFGHEAGLFCPSGTMANQIGLNVHTRPGDEVICEEGAHVYRYEGGGLMANSGCSVKLLRGDRGRFTADDVRASYGDPNDPHAARSRVVVIENTHNRGGGSLWDIEAVRSIHGTAHELGLAMHMDGARIFNALIATGADPKAWGALFDSISICLSKGLGAPVGSVLIGSAAHIQQARRVRKRLGGGMRQVGILAAAGLHALDNHVQRLADDHRRARELGAGVAKLPYVQAVMPVDTNIVVFTVAPDVDLVALLAALRERGVLAVRFGPQMVRMVTHLDVNDEDIHRVIAAMKAYQA